jgi:hypothetical protein
MKKISLMIFVFTVFLTNPLLAADVSSRILENGGTGQYKAVMTTEPSLSTHTVFAPQDISAFNEKNPLPLLVWGNGACYDSPWEHVNFLNEVASHGFLVIATGVMPQETGDPVTTRSKASKLVDAMDWAIAQNNDSKSRWHKKIATNKIAVSGMSCGGLQALEVAGDPRVTTLGVFNSGIFKDAVRGNAMPGMPQLDKTQLEKIHTPTLYLLGGVSDIAYGNGMDDVDNINHVPIFVGNMDVGHGGTYAQPHGGEYAKVATAWYQWQLKGDDEAGKMFTGEKPGLANSPEWTIAKKNLP